MVTQELQAFRRNNDNPSSPRRFVLSLAKLLHCIGGHGTLQKYRGTGTRYFAKISSAVPVLSN